MWFIKYSEKFNSFNGGKQKHEKIKTLTKQNKKNLNLPELNFLLVLPRESENLFIFFFFVVHMNTCQCTRFDQKITVIFKFRKLRFLHFLILLCWYTWLLYTRVDNIIIRIALSVCFWQIKMLVVFWYWKKMKQGNCIKFCVKNEIK